MNPARGFGFLLIVFLGGCWGSARSLKPPDLSEETSEIDQTVERLTRVDGSMRRDIDQFEGLRARFFDVQSSFFAAPFPLDTFKHAAMSCLNEPHREDASPAPELKAAAERLGVACAVLPLSELDRALSEVPERRERALELLRTIDRLREVRTRLQKRLRQLPAITSRTRNYLASRRAEIRTVERSIERRRPEYRASEYRESIDRIEAYRARLDALDESISQLETRTPTWSRQLGVAIDRLYKDLSRLGRS